MKTLATQSCEQHKPVLDTMLLAAEVERLKIENAQLQRRLIAALGTEQTQALLGEENSIERLVQTLQVICNLCDAPHWAADRRWRIRDLAEREIKRVRASVGR